MTRCLTFYEQYFMIILKPSAVNGPFHFPCPAQITPLMESVNCKLPRPYIHFTFFTADLKLAERNRRIRTDQPTIGQLIE